MIRKLQLKNFRAIVDSEIELGRITILTGPNNSGKSTIIYGLLALKNILLNSNQSLDSCLSLGFINLGGFSQNVHFKDEDLNIHIGIDMSKDGADAQYLAVLGKQKSELNLKATRPLQAAMNLEVAFPYPANKNTGCEIKGNFGVAKVTWNGITPTITIEKGESGSQEEIDKLNKSLSLSLNGPIEELRAVDFVPLRRGFVKPVYSAVPMQPNLLTEDELATLLATDRDLEGKVGHYLEKIVPRVFTVRPTVGTANFSLQSRDRSTGFVSDLVNEGFGTNQLVTMFTKALRKEMRTICIEEAEIHLHPEAMSKLVDVFIEITKDEDKSFIISTHSEHIILSLLNKVAQGKVDPADLRAYYLLKDGRRTKVEKQEITEKGQIKGGLRGFYEAELNEVKEFFKIPESE